MLLHFLFEAGNITMLEGNNSSFAQAAAVNDARMIQFVAENDVSLMNKRWNRP